MARNLNNLTTEELRELAAQNSANWTPGAAGDALHAQNVEINNILDSRNGTNSTFDSGTGTWTTKSGRGAYSGGASGYTGGYSGAGELGYDPDTDYSSYLTELLNQGNTNYDYLDQLLGERGTKAVNTGYSQYANDPFAQSVRDYISNGRASQSQASLQNIMSMMQELQPSSAPSYSSEWDDLKGELAKAALGMNYEDWTQSDQYKALANRYSEQGNLSMRDVLAQIASKTGGLASSYAVTAAQQQYNDYMARLEDAARSAYNTERQNAISNAQLASDYSGSDYQRYLNQLSQYNNDRSYAFDVLSKALSQSNYEKEWQNTLDAQQYERQRAAEQEQYERDLLKAKTLAGAGDYSGYSALGYSNDEIAALQAAALLANNAASGTNGTSGSRRSSGGGGGSGGGDLDYDGLFEAAKASGNPRSWLAQKVNYTQYGFTSSSGLYNDYQEWEKGQSSKTADGGWNEDEPFKNPLAPGGRNPSAGNTTSGIPLPSSFADFKRTISGLLETGQVERAQALADQYDLTDSQYKDLMTLFNANGYR